MGLPPNLRPIVTRVCRHEAGHRIVAQSLGFGTDKVCIMVRNGSHLATSEITPATALSTAAEVAQHLRNRVIVLYAGALAEAMENGAIDNEAALGFLREGGAMDYAKARELIHVLRSIEHGVPASAEENQRQLTALDEELWNAAADAVVRERECIEAVGHALEAKVEHVGHKYELTQEEIFAVPVVRKRFAGAPEVVPALVPPQLQSPS